MELKIQEEEKKPLTALQRAKKKYYEKIKNTEKYREMRNSPKIKSIINEASKKFYDKIKDDPEFKRKVSEQKREYYLKKKGLKLL